MGQVEERTGDGFQLAERLAVTGRKPAAGDPAPALLPERFGSDMGHVRPSDSAGIARLPDRARSPDMRVCPIETRRRDWLRAHALADPTVDTAGMDCSLAPGFRNGAEGVGHPALPTHKGEAFGRGDGVLRKEQCLVQRAVFVIDRAARIAYAEDVPDPMQEPDDDAAAAPARRAVQA